jgi:hypothetical protein
MPSIILLDPIAFACPACGQRFSAPAGFAGRVLPCQACRAEMTVPDPSADPHATMLREPNAATVASVGLDTTVVREPDATTTPAPRVPTPRPSGVVPWPTRPPA